MRCSDRELFFAEGSSSWPEESRDALAAIVRTRSENARLHRVIEQQDRADEPQTRATEVEGIVGDAPVMREVYDRILRVAPRDVVVLILGASGTGKELAARAIHRHSLRRSRTFTAINCAALPENLIESELFGHARGAFTGADRDRAGLIESADGGTLFLDEAGELPLAAQAKLLRFLQDGEFRRVGDASLRTADVRILSATNRQLEAAVENGTFREDLYYRLRGVEIALLPLRERGNDVLLLANHFLTLERGRHRAGPVALASEVEMLFRAYRWPGNVRELQNTIRAAHAMAGDEREITLEHLPERLRAAMPVRQPAGSYQDAVTRFRRELIEKSLLEAAGNQNRAAAILNISRQALAYQIRELGIMVRKGVVGKSERSRV
jgi:transcriptional regulator with PAS, ATPase and Fis domain